MITVLLTVYNRINNTIRCLQSLYAQEGSWDFRVFLVDDGSTDNTRQILKEIFPKVCVIPGNGNLYWNKGMLLAWSESARLECHAYLWLNNDTYLKPYALKKLIDTMKVQLRDTGKQGVVVGACHSKISADQTPVTTYGGRNLKGLIEPASKPVPVPFMNGNVVLVAKDVFTSIGNLSDVYHHAWGDYDYGIRANRAGFPVWLAPGHLAICDSNGVRPYRDIKRSFNARIEALRAPTGVNFKELHHMLKLTGCGNIVFSFVKQWFLAFFPRFGCKFH